MKNIDKISHFRKITIRQKIGFVFLGIFLFLLLLEAGLRAGKFIFSFLQEYRNRASIKQEGTYRIMCLGESTTAIGGENSYPSQLEDILNQQDIGIKFSVINKGIIGTSTGVIVSQLGNNLNKYTPDMVITMMGINDGRKDVVQHKDYGAAKAVSFIKTLKIYKLQRLLWLHIKDKFNLTKDWDYIKLGQREKLYGKYEKAESMYKKAIEINPKNDTAYFELGILYEDYKRDSEAKRMYKKAVEINPQNDKALVKLGRLYGDQKKYDKLEKLLKKAIDINPSNLIAYIELAHMYVIQKKYDKAAEILKRGVKVNPEDWNAYIYIGYYYSQQGKYDKAEEMYKKAIEAAVDNDKLYDKLAVLYEGKDKEKIKEEYFRKANKLRLERCNPETRRNYQKLKKITAKRGIKLICVQYPMRSVKPLEKMLGWAENVFFVDNENVFKKAVKQASYDEYFVDKFGGAFGHCTPKGNRLLANNIAKVIFEECFGISMN